MNIKVGNKNEEYNISQDDFDEIEYKFKTFNIQPTEDQVLSLLDESTYYEIKKHGVNDTVVSDDLYVDAIKLMTGNFSNHRNGNDFYNYKIDIHQEALNRGFKALDKTNTEFYMSSKKDVIVKDKAQDIEEKYSDTKEQSPTLIL